MGKHLSAADARVYRQDEPLQATASVCGTCRQTIKRRGRHGVWVHVSDGLPMHNNPWVGEHWAAPERNR